MKIVSRHVNKRATSNRVFDKPLFSYAVERLFNQNSPETYECLKKVFRAASTIATTYEPILSRFSAGTEKLFLKRRELQSQTHTPSGRIEFCRTNKALRVSIKNDIEMNLHNKIDKAIKKHRSRVDGTIAASKEGVAKTVQAFYNSLYASQQSSPAIIGPSQDDLPSFLPSEIRTALRKAKRGKAPGPDFITLEMLLAAEENAVPLLASIYNECLQNERTPTSMSDSMVSLLHKKGSCLEIGNCSLDVDHPQTLPLHPKKTGRTVSGISTTYRTNGISTWILDLRKHTGRLRNDPEKAFDSVEFGSLWTALSEFGVHSKIVNTLKNIYDEAKCLSDSAGTTSQYKLEEACDKATLFRPTFSTLLLSMYFEDLTGVNMGYSSTECLSHTSDDHEHVGEMTSEAFLEKIGRPLRATIRSSSNLP
ncbi:unnamed protein product [Caenorhabditis auriculariae]|uniref:Reverse transcriptase domain-containing protein n=1 Tax=Caenorhabditis auriculariae TaxID=2777116 RepID=A0A8S1GXH7_9PELO|nr:unnamed protein product [Caenorhabditis auriculariae]